MEAGVLRPSPAFGFSPCGFEVASGERKEEGRKEGKGGMKEGKKEIFRWAPLA